MIEAIFGIIGATLIGLGSIAFSYSVYKNDESDGMIAFLLTLLIITFCLCTITDLGWCR